MLAFASALSSADLTLENDPIDSLLAFSDASGLSLEIDLAEGCLESSDLAHALLTAFLPLAAFPLPKNATNSGKRTSRQRMAEFQQAAFLLCSDDLCRHRTFSLFLA